MKTFVMKPMPLAVDFLSSIALGVSMRVEIVMIVMTVGLSTIMKMNKYQGRNQVDISAMISKLFD